MGNTLIEKSWRHCDVAADLVPQGCNLRFLNEPTMVGQDLDCPVTRSNAFSG